MFSKSRYFFNKLNNKVILENITYSTVSYVQGQSPEKKIREYFYYIDHQGMVGRSIYYCINHIHTLFTHFFTLVTLFEYSIYNFVTPVDYLSYRFSKQSVVLSHKTFWPIRPVLFTTFQFFVCIILTNCIGN